MESSEFGQGGRGTEGALAGGAREERQNQKWGQRKRCRETSDSAGNEAPTGCARNARGEAKKKIKWGWRAEKVSKRMRKV